VNDSIEAIGLAASSMLEADDFESLAMLADHVKVWSAHQSRSDMERASIMVHQWIEYSVRRREHFKTRLLGQQSNTIRLKTYTGHTVAL
jgi:hypothetical protein